MRRRSPNSGLSERKGFLCKLRQGIPFVAISSVLDLPSLQGKCGDGLDGAAIENGGNME